MAVSLARVNTAPHALVAGSRVEVFTDITLDSAYSTGGYTITPASLGLSAIDWLTVALSPATGGVLFTYNYSTGKLQAFQNTGAETSANVDLHTCIGRLFAIGQGFALYATAA